MALASPMPDEIDSMVFDCLTDPQSLKRFSRESRAYVRVDLCHRQYWHTFFDICPRALDVSPPDGLDILHPFMAWAAREELTFDWSFYLWVYEWMRQSKFRDRLDEDLLIEIMGASAARWAVQERSSDCGLAIGSAGVPVLVVAWKCRKVDGGREVELIELEQPLPETPGFFGYFTLRSFEFDSFPGWRPIPR
jgi:uncharacterized repeat protein (TIGR04061 family)